MSRWFLGLWLLFSAAAHAEIRVQDALGQDFVLQQPAQRIVALAPHLVENLFAIGAGEHIVGTISYADYPAAAKAIPRFGNHQSLSYEAVVAARPDVVMAWMSGNGMPLVQRLRELGLKVFVSEPKNFASIAQSLRDLGRLTGLDDKAELAATQFEQGLAALRAQRAQDTPVTVFYEIWHEPLQTLNGEHLISEVIRFCGGRNIFAQAPALAPKVSVEAVLSLAPQVIIGSASATQQADKLQRWQQWPQLPAVAQGHVYRIQPELIQRHTLRILQGTTRMCELLQAAR